ncbi:hypothetical protein ABI59_03980 [Acidobacteria bacterium Mor1]|nr:hypothetical protein ABI59_03980 [Acidobacteria bacterium Mor1]
MSRKHLQKTPFTQTALIAALILAAGCSGAVRPPQKVATAPLYLELPAAAGALEPALEERLGRARNGDRIQVLVDLTRQVDQQALAARVLADKRERSARRADVIDWFETVANEQQATLEPTLDGWIDEGLIDYYRGVAIVNRLIVEGSPDGIRRLAGHPAVARILADTRSPGSGLAERPASPALGESFTSWALEALGIDQAWGRGLDGSGVRVGIIDTGVHGRHEQLADRMAGEGRGWFDPVQGLGEPYDNNGHGTSVLSTAVGRGESRRIGIAPGATWSAALANWQNRYSRVRMTLAADWMFRVARPDVLINAWSNPERDVCAGFDLPFIRAWQASGIFVVFPAGNAGPGDGSGESPAQLLGAFPDGRPVFAVAATRDAGGISDMSSRGPSACGDHPFPRLSAPGEDLPIAIPVSESGYAPASGTSLSAGVVGGIAALLLQAAPDLEPWELEDLLIDTAQDIPPSGFDGASGTGNLNLPAALKALDSR